MSGIVISLSSLASLLPSLFCFLICLYLVQAKSRSKPLRWFLIFSHLGICALSVFYIVADSLSGNGIDESVFFHLFYGMNGAGTKDFVRLYILASTFAVFVLLAGYWILRGSRLSGKVHRHISDAAIIGLFFSFYLNPASRDLSRFLVHAQFVDSPSGMKVIRMMSDDAIGATTGDWDADNDSDGMNFDEFYHEPKGADFSAGRPNIVYLYLESFERTYFDEKSFPGLVKHLKRFQKQALNFSGIQQVFGTSWTIGGIVASQCGVPLVTTGAHGNEMGRIDEFLPGARCIGEALRDEGYHLAFRGGADLGFAGKGKFFKNHGFADVKGLHELRPQLRDPSYLNSWGLYDDSLFEGAYQDFLKLGQGSRPFGLFLLTVDTHHPEGHIPRACKDAKYGDGENAVLNAVKCSDANVGQFLDRIFASPYAANTVVVIASDHLAMPNTARDQLEALDRRNLLLVIPPGKRISQEISRKGSTLDIAPTLLHVLTGKAQPVGLGRSLLDPSSQTLVEELGERVDDQLKGWSSDIRKFWRLPRITEPIQVAVGEQSIVVGGRTVHYPALIELDKDLQITKILFSDPDFPLYQRAFGKAGSRVIWVDDCKSMKILSMKVSTDSFCFLAGVMGSANTYVQPVTNDFELPVEMIQKVVL